MSSPITTHILDTSVGRPAAGVDALLEVEADGGWNELTRGTTDDDGRIRDWMGAGTLDAGTFRITFDTGAYFAKKNVRAFYPYVSIVFRVDEGDEHYHVPLLLNPFGYSTYRGS